MAACFICKKGVNFGNMISHSHRRSNRAFNPNIQKVKAVVDGAKKKICVCTRCLRSGRIRKAV